MKNKICTTTTLSKIGFSLLLLLLLAGEVSAHRSPVECSGSGLSINLFADKAQVKIGNVISYSAVVFNGSLSGPIVCDATEITASITTPDGQDHPISLKNTALSNGKVDDYANVLSYTARKEDVKSDGTLTATAKVSGNIHQNDTDSLGGGNQGLNVTVIADVIIPIPEQSPTPSSTPPPATVPSPVTPAVVIPPVVVPPAPPSGGGSSSGGGGGYVYYQTPTPSPVIVATTSTTTIAIVPYFPNTGLPPREQNHSIGSRVLSGLVKIISNSFGIFFGIN